MNKVRVQELIAVRRKIHQNPELGYQEIETAKFICSKLDELGIPYQYGVAKTGIVAEIEKGSGDGKCIALRADMDALPMSEETNLVFASTKKGVMHACGHDIHTTVLLGAIMELQESDFNGKIKFVFQPSEEGTNGDVEKKSGGQRVVEEGVIDDVDYALGLHVHPLLEVGKLSYVLGNALACANHLRITVFGKSGHAGAAPHLANDAIVTATALVQNLHTIISRNIDPTQTGVLSITKINGGVVHNVIADKVEIEGTVRALDINNYNLIMKRIESIVEGVATAYDTKIDVSVDLFYPSVINSSIVHQELKDTAEQVFPQGLVELPPVMAGEDFAFFSRKVPSMFYFLGARDNNSDEHYFLHHPKVVFDEDCIEYGVEFMKNAALKLLS